MDPSLLQLVENLALASLMVAVTVLIHFWGLLFLTRLMGGAHARLRPHAGYLRLKPR